MASDLLTILLPLKGRHLHTLRFLWHANEIKLPHRILIADGQVHPRIAGLVENPATFPSLSIDYVHYPDDASFSHFFRKMADATTRVRTPYVKIVDNDDFLGAAGLLRSVEFLEENADFVCCGGGVAGFAVDEISQTSIPNVVGRVNRVSYRYTDNYRSRDLAADSVTERVLDAYRNYKATYYDVFRASAMHTLWSEMAEIDFSDLQLFEYFGALRAMTMGKSHSDASAISYLRQYRTSMRTAFTKDWVHHLVHSRYSHDLDAMTDRIAGLVVAAEGGERAKVAEELRDITASWLRTFLKQNYGVNSVVIKEALRDRVPDWLMKLRRMRHGAVARERSALFSKLRADGASEDYLATFREELNLIERSLREDGFPAFLRAQAPDLLPAKARE